MELSSDLFHLIQNMAVRPDFGTAVVLFWFSLINELFSILPYVVLVSGQFFFIEAKLSYALAYKIFFLVALPAGVGGAIGTLLTYGLAYFGGKPAIEKFEKYLRFSWEDIEKLNRRFKGAWYDELIFLALRSTPFLPALPINIAAGVLRIPPLNYFVLTVLGYILRMMIIFAIILAGTEALV